MPAQYAIKSNSPYQGLVTRSYQPLSKSDINRIHEASLTVLERTGIQLGNSEARDLFVEAGAQADGDRVLIPRGMVEDALAKACKSFVLAGRNPAHDMLMGDHRVYLGTGPDGFCVFFDQEKACLIHTVKPDICSLWPFYPANVKDEETWELAKDACPGINPECSFEEFVRQSKE